MLEDLFSHTRLKRPLTWHHLLFFVYFPFGLTICLVRFVLSVKQDFYKSTCLPVCY